MFKVCSKCKTEKPYEQFHKDKRRKDGIQSKCKECVREYDKKYRQENKEKLKERLKNRRKENKEKFREWEKNKYNKHKNKILEKSKKYREEHKEAISERGKKYYEENKEVIIERVHKYNQENREKISEKNKKYYEENKEKINEKNKKYREENRESLNEWKNEYIKNRRKTDEGYRIVSCLRTRLRSALKGKTKSAPTMELIGVPSIEFLRDYLEGTKVEGKDYTDAHVDHIRPCASFDLTDPEQQRECFHYTNLQLLPALENISKGAKLVY